MPTKSMTNRGYCSCSYSENSEITTEYYIIYVEQDIV